jgi:Fur family transcriptional regulator, ferric uptake regulator
MSSSQRLKQASLRITEGRIAILDFFYKNSGLGISIHDLLAEFSSGFDKVTMYRTLHSFEEKGILHKVIDETGLERYALCQEVCHDHNGHQHEHVHFKCTQCQKTECLDEQTRPQLKLPLGYTKTEANYLILGICKDCNS